MKLPALRQPPGMTVREQIQWNLDQCVRYLQLAVVFLVLACLVLVVKLVVA